MENTVLRPSEFYLSLAKSRAWVFFHKNLHTFGILLMCAIALGMLQVVLLFAFPEMSIMWVSYFSFAMNTILLTLLTLSVIGWAGLYFFKDLKIEFGGEKPQMLLEEGSISIAPDTLIMSLAADESAESFKARMDAAFAAASEQQWVLVIAFRHYSFSVLMTSDVGKEGVGYFLRTHPFQDISPTISETDASMKQYNKETFAQYVDYCRALADDFRVWAAHQKIERTNPFTGAAEWLKSQAVLPLVFLFAMLPGFALAQKTKQVEQYLGDRAAMATEKGKEVSYIFERREISCISRGGSYIETLKSVPFFQDVSDAGRLLLIKVGNQKILPKSPTKQRQETSEAAVVSDAVPVPESVPGGGFYESLPDSLEANALINKDKADRQREWVQVKPSVGLWMYRFHRLLIGLFILGCFLWVVAVIGASESVNDLGAIKVVSDFLVSVYVVSKSALIGIWIFALGVYTLEAMITNWFTGELSAYFFGKFIFMAVFSAVLFKWVFPDLQKRRGSNSSIVTSNYPGQRQLNG